MPAHPFRKEGSQQPKSTTQKVWTQSPASEKVATFSEIWQNRISLQFVPSEQSSETSNFLGPISPFRDWI
jgi:hypothetical protein